MSKRPIKLMMAGGEFVGHMFAVLVVAVVAVVVVKNLQVINEGVSNV